MTSSGVGSWKIARLADLTTLISSGSTPKGGAEVYLDEGPVMLIRSQNVRMNQLSLDDVAYITAEMDASMARARVHYGDVLLNITGASIGRVASFDLIDVKANVNQHVCVIRPRPDLLSYKYLSHLIATAEFQAEIDRLQHGGTRQALTFGQIAEFEIPHPPLSEQRRIADVLDRAEALRAKRRAALAELATLSSAIFHQICGDPASNPRRWPTVRLSELVRTDDSINYGVVQPGDDLDEGVPLIRVGDLHDGQIRSSGLKRISPSIESNYKRSRLCGDEILLSCVGSIGMVALADESLKGFNIARAVTRIRLSDEVNRVYVAKYLESAFVQNYFTRELRTVSQPTLNIKQIAETEVRLPPYEVQQAFARRIAVVEKLKETCQFLIS